MEFFSSALEKYTTALLSKISEDYSLPLDELVSKYQSSSVSLKTKKKRSAPKDDVPRVPCVGMTGKGTACKNKCQAGSDKCHLHGVEVPNKEPRVPKVPKSKSKSKSKAAKKVQPEHNHPPGSQSSDEQQCQLCETHGNVVIPKLPQFESKSLQDRLAEILKSETQETETETETETVAPPPSPEKAKAKAKAKAKPKPKAKAPKKAKSPEPEPPKPEAVKVPKTATIEERMALILAEEEPEEEPESPGAVRHRLIMAEKGRAVEYDEEDEEDDEDGCLSEEEFEE
jgi:cell division protein FtsN